MLAREPPRRLRPLLGQALFPAEGMDHGDEIGDMGQGEGVYRLLGLRYAERFVPPLQSLLGIPL